MSRAATTRTHPEPPHRGPVAAPVLAMGRRYASSPPTAARVSAPRSTTRARDGEGLFRPPSVPPRVTGFAWPEGFDRAPDEDWARGPVDELAQKYDSVERHGWYDNLDPTVDEVLRGLRDGAVVVDYSGGTGILIGRLLAAAGARSFGVVNVDSSPKFLRLSFDKFRDEPRVAFRLLRWLRDEKRLQDLDEALGPAMAQRGVDVVVSANAIHLYYDLDRTLRSWARCLRPGGRALVQSGNVLHPDGGVIIDSTVAAVDREARAMVREDARFARFRPELDDDARMARYDALRQKYFLPARPLAFYVDELERAGLRVVDVRTKRIEARTDEWLSFLAVYHEGILGWAGGAEKVEGRAPTAEDVAARKELLGLALRRALRDRDSFDATWTYVSAVKP